MINCATTFFNCGAEVGQFYPGVEPRAGQRLQRPSMLAISPQVPRSSYCLIQLNKDNCAKCDLFCKMDEKHVKLAHIYSVPLSNYKGPEQ